MTYLGTTLTGNVTDHIGTRIQSARRAYYSLQGAGVCCDGVAPKTLRLIYKGAIQPILTYGCSAINITDRSVKCLEKTHCILRKTALVYQRTAETPTVRCPWNRKDRSTHQETATHSIKKCTAG